jgi:hypothetical protein
LTAKQIYGFDQKTPQGKNQQAQTPQEAALESSQEAHLAEVILRAVQFIRSRAIAILNRRERSLFACAKIL